MATTTKHPAWPSLSDAVRPPHLPDAEARLAGLARRAAPWGGGAPLTVLSPFTQEPIGFVGEATAGDVAAAAAAARAAQRGWAARPYGDRAAVVLRLYDLLLDRREEILDVVQLESGKARRHAFEELVDSLLTASHYARRAGRLLRTEQRRGILPLLGRGQVHYPPLGLVGLIAPWNYPWTLALSDALPALLAGNAVLLKPSELTPFSALLAAELLEEAGLPPALFTVLLGRGEQVGAPLIDEVDFIGFTGSTAVGRIIARRAGERLIPSSLELGGKNPFLVLADADVDAAVEGAVRGCFANAGQLCVSFERIYVAAPLYEPFRDALVARVERMRVGTGYEAGVEMGCLVNPAQLAQVTAHVDDARAHGATILTGGRALPEIGPLFYAPTLVEGGDEGLRLRHAETFGPVAALYPFGTEDEAVARANDSDYGLNACIWTRDLRRGRALARRLQAGTVNLNEAYAATWGAKGLPMGGFKASGLGRRFGQEGLRKYTETQSVASWHGPTLAAPVGARPEAFQRLVGRLLRLLPHLPGVR